MTMEAVEVAEGDTPDIPPTVQRRPMAEAAEEGVVAEGTGGTGTEAAGEEADTAEIEVEVAGATEAEDVVEVADTEETEAEVMVGTEGVEAEDSAAEADMGRTRCSLTTRSSCRVYPTTRRRRTLPSSSAASASSRWTGRLASLRSSCTRTKTPGNPRGRPPSPTTIPTRPSPLSSGSTARTSTASWSRSAWP